MISTGTPLAPAILLRFRKKSNPSITGMLMSLKIKSNPPFSAATRPSAPLLASRISAHSRPAERSARSTIFCITEESSTINALSFIIHSPRLPLAVSGFLAFRNSEQRIRGFSDLLRSLNVGMSRWCATSRCSDRGSYIISNYCLSV